MIAALSITLPEWPVLQMVMHGRQDMTANAEAKPARDIDYIPAVATPICLFPPVNVLIPTSCMSLSVLQN